MFAENESADFSTFRVGGMFSENLTGLQPYGHRSVRRFAFYYTKIVTEYIICFPVVSNQLLLKFDDCVRAQLKKNCASVELVSNRELGKDVNDDGKFFEHNVLFRVLIFLTLSL